MSNQESTTAPNFGTSTERLPGSGRIVIRYPSGKVVDAPADAPLTQWPNENPPAKAGK